MKFSTFCFLARTHLLAAGFALTHAQTLELGSALLGYRTHAALKSDSDHGDVLVKADHVILQVDELARRMSELGFNAHLAHSWLDAFAMALSELLEKIGGTCRVHHSMIEFEEFIAQDVQERAFSDVGVLGAYADTNSAIDEFYVDACEYDPLLQTDGEWVLKASGSHTGEIDRDRPYSGHSGDFEATYRFAKDGRSGLTELELEFELDFTRDFT